MKKNKFISEIIKDYLEKIDTSEFDPQNDDLEDLIDSDYLSNLIFQKLESQALTFRHTPTVINNKSANTGLGYSCSSCGHVHGVWIGSGGIEMPDSILNKNGNHIVILHDIL